MSMRGEVEDTPISPGGGTVVRNVEGRSSVWGMLILRSPRNPEDTCVAPVSLHVELRGELRMRDVD